MSVRDMKPDDDPVKVVLQRRALPGKRAAFEAWVQELLRLAAREAELEGSSVLNAGDSECFILLRFANRGELTRFETSPDVSAHLDRGAALASAAGAIPERTGLETWFDLPGLPAGTAAPARWKMALVTWIALLPQVILLSLVMPTGVPFLLQVSLSTAIPVCMLTWVIMPRLTKLLARWLYAEPELRATGALAKPR